MGGALIGLAVRELRRAETPAEPWEPTTAIVSGGPYALSRHPIYLGLSAIYIGAALLARSMSAVVLLGPVISVMRRGVIEREERYLARRRGASASTARAPPAFGAGCDPPEG